MKHIVKLPSNERAELFDIAAAKLKIPAGLIEKDFWVCYILDILFRCSSYKNSLLFKGGTCLSKAFNLIERFSEDVDLALDWRLLGYTETEPWEERSNSAQEKFKKDCINRTNNFLENDFISELVSVIYNDSGLNADVFLADEEETILFRYPKEHTLAAILGVIRLEIGPMAAWTPMVNTSISCYLSKCIDVDNNPDTIVRAVSPERTFWEKVTILHQEANRSEDKRIPARYSRHYYDVAKLCQTYVKKNALKNIQLLQTVVIFKEKFYRTPWAKLPDAATGSVRLVPYEYRIPELSKDYVLMQDMLFGNKPDFIDVLQELSILEKEINEASIH
ncbi:MAG: nucleotidyl transferase AbiEii/AbiGii toxin family protein [Oscillospiraceae bacterium]|jgi:predicted nucleotidyltransferase component of viral defense system|nr:nucleotidyl transferase AbiEii/AbiGii toxin family protein [Oscillospiraceae bacterium]